MKTSGYASFEVNAAGFVRAAPRQAWHVLTDYDRLPEFVPDLKWSKLLSRRGREAIVEQRSEPEFFFMSQTIRVILRVTEQPHSSINVALLSGDMKHYSAHWELAPMTCKGIDGTRILYSGIMEPDFFVPPPIGQSIAQTTVGRMMDAVVMEIERRAFAGRGPAK